MAWIKRNLYFVIGGAVAFALMVAGGFYLFTQVAAENELADKIKSQYAELTRLISQNPHPGYGAIDNIKAAKAESAALRGYITKTRGFFQRIAPIPDVGGGKINNSDFNAGLRNTMNQLHHDAEQQSVMVNKDYYFTFESQKKIVVFDAASLDKVAVQLGEVKTICELLFAAKINSLDYIRREAVSADDKNQSDYVTHKSVMTPLAELTPYEVKFRCFSPELALVMANLASSPYGLIVKTINVEPTSASGEEVNISGNPTANGVTPTPAPQPNPPGRNRPGTPSGTVATRGGPQKFLTEKPFTVTLLIQVVKLKPEGAKPAK